MLRIIRITYSVTFHHFSSEPWHFRGPRYVFTHTLLISNPKHCHFGLSLLNSSRFTRLKRTDVLMQSKILSSNVFYRHLNLEQTLTVKINCLMSWLTVKYFHVRRPRTGKHGDRSSDGVKQQESTFPWERAKKNLKQRGSWRRGMSLMLHPQT